MKEIREYDERGNLIYYRYSYGREIWKEYDINKDVIYYKDSYHKGWEHWAKYDENYNIISITQKEFENIKIREYNLRTKCSRFELMDI